MKDIQYSDPKSGGQSAVHKISYAQYRWNGDGISMREANIVITTGLSFLKNILELIPT